MTAIRRAQYPDSGVSAERAFWLGKTKPPAAADDGFDDAAEVYGEPLRFVRAPSAAASRVPQLIGFAVVGLLAGMLLATVITTTTPKPPCDAISLRPLALWQPDSARLRLVKGRVR